jgi:hypothetical protein
MTPSVPGTGGLKSSRSRQEEDALTERSAARMKIYSVTYMYTYIL